MSMTTANKLKKRFYAATKLRQQRSQLRKGRGPVFGTLRLKTA